MQATKKPPQVSYRRKARIERGLTDAPNLRAVMINGRPGVLFSTEDMTGGLVGCPSYGCAGYQPESCYALLRNAIVFGANGGRRTARGSVAAAGTGRCGTRGAPSAPGCGPARPGRPGRYGSSKQDSTNSSSVQIATQMAVSAAP